MEKLLINEINRIYDCDVLAKNRLRKNVDGRIAFSNYLRNNSKLSFQKIGNILNLGHATIMHSIEKHSELIKFNKEYRELYSKIGVYSGLKRWLCFECVFEIRVVK